MKKRIYLPLLSLILVFSLFSLVPAARVFVKELYDRSFGFAKKAVSSNDSQSENTGSADASGPRWILVDTSYTVVEDKHYGYYDVVHSFEILLKATLTGRCGLSVPAVIFKMGTITSAATSIMSA